MSGSSESGKTSRDKKAGTIVVFSVSIAIAALLASVDTTLLRLANRERIADADKLYRRAQKLESNGSSREALDLYRHARNEQRKNITYRIALIRALQRSGLFSEAETEGTRLVGEQPSAGPVNLVMARLLESDNRFDEAAWYYHRALYGNWSAQSDTERRGVRLELADMLARRHETGGVVAEVLLLLNEVNGDVEIRRRSAQLLLRAGSWTRAASLFAELVRENPSDAALHSGLGLAYFGDKDYRRARSELLTASRSEKVSDEVRNKLQVAEMVVQLNPYVRGIGEGERARRKKALLRETVDISRSCLGEGDLSMLSSAQNMLEKRSVNAAESDTFLETAERLWNALPAPCKSNGKGQALSILLVEMSS